MKLQNAKCKVGELKIKAGMTGVQGADTHGHVNYVRSRSVNMLHCHIGIGSAKCLRALTSPHDDGASKVRH